MTQKYYCPCCGSDNTKVAGIEKNKYDDPTIEDTTLVSIWCYNCPESIFASVEVHASYEPHPDIGSYNIMDPLTRHLKERSEDDT